MAVAGSFALAYPAPQEVMLRRRVLRSFDPALVATHDRISGGLMRNNLDSWVLPKVTDRLHRQRIMKSTSYIVDPVCRQKVARDMELSADVDYKLLASSVTAGRGLKLRHDGTMQLGPVVFSLASVATTLRGSAPALSSTQPRSSPLRAATPTNASLIMQKLQRCETAAGRMQSVKRSHFDDLAGGDLAEERVATASYGHQWHAPWVSHTDWERVGQQVSASNATSLAAETYWSTVSRMGGPAASNFSQGL